MSDLFGSGNFDEILAQVQKLQDNLEQTQQDVGEDFVGTSGGGAVSIAVNGEFQFTSVHIDQKVIDPSGSDLLEDLILAAVRDAAQQVKEHQQAAVGKAMSSAFGELFGGAAPDLSGLLPQNTDSDTQDH